MRLFVTGLIRLIRRIAIAPMNLLRYLRFRLIGSESRKIGARNLVFFIFTLLAYVLFLHGPIWDPVLNGDSTHSLVLGEIEFGGNYVKWHKQRQEPVLLDRNGILIGAVPAVYLPKGKKDELTQSKYRTIPTNDIPTPWWEMVKLLEDQNRGRWFHINGIDISQWPKIPIRYIMGQGLSGGSTLEMQLVKTLQQDTDAKNSSRWLRKLRDILHAPVLANQLSKNDEKELAAWSAAHFPLTNSGFHGLTAASYQLFSRHPRDLTLAQQAVLASAIKYRVDTIYGRISSWELTKDRARHVLRLMKTRNLLEQKQYKEALGDLDEMAYPRLVPEEDLRKCLDNRSLLSRDRAARMLDYRLVLLAKGELLQVKAELKDLKIKDWIDNLSVIQLNLDIRKNCQFKWAIQDIKKEMISRVSTRQSQLGVPEKETIAQKKHYLTMAIGNNQGEILYFYSDSEYPQYHGYNLGKGGKQLFQPYDHKKELRPIGSVAKAAAALVAGHEGDTRSTKYFQQSRKKITGRYPYEKTSDYQNANGFKGYANRSNKKGWITAEKAFARSDNLAIMDRLEKIGDREILLQIAKEFGWTPKKTRYLPIDIPLGQLYASPRIIQTGVHALFKGSLHDTSDFPCDFKIIKNIEWLSNRESRPENDNTVNCQAIERRSASTSDFVKTVLSAPLSARLKGTAQGLKDYRSHKKTLIQSHIAKTGTVNSGRIINSSLSGTKYAVLSGAMKVENQIYSYIAQLGPIGSERDLGPRIYGSDLTPFIKLGLDRVMKEHKK